MHGTICTEMVIFEGKPISSNMQNYRVPHVFLFDFKHVKETFIIIFMDENSDLDFRIYDCLSCGRKICKLYYVLHITMIGGFSLGDVEEL